MSRTKRWIASSKAWLHSAMSWIKRGNAGAKARLQSDYMQKSLFWCATGLIVVALFGFGYTAFIDRQVAELEDEISHRRARLRGAIELQKEAIEVHQRIQQWRALIDMLREQKAKDDLILQHEMILLQEHIAMANLAVESAVAASVMTVEQGEMLRGQLNQMHGAIVKKG